VEEKDELTRQIVVSGQKPFNHPKYGGSMGESTRVQIWALAKNGLKFKVHGLKFQLMFKESILSSFIIFSNINYRVIGH